MESNDPAHDVVPDVVPDVAPDVVPDHASRAEPLPLLEKIGYGLGDYGINFHFSMTTNFLLFFYTEVFGLLPAVAGTVLLVARISDALTDPLMGLIADRTHSRWGKLRPYLLFGAVPLGVASVLLFSVPTLSPGAKVAYAYATYILYGVAFTIVTIPYSALTASITSDAQQRTELSTFRIGFATLGGGSVAVFTPAAPKIGERLGKAWGMVACSGLGFVSGLAIYFTPYDQIAMIFLWSMLGALSGSPIGVLTWSIIPDTVEYAEWKTGIRAEGIIYAVTGFFQKFAGALGGALSGFILSATGYVAGVADRTGGFAGISRRSAAPKPRRRPPQAPRAAVPPGCPARNKTARA